MVEFDKRIAHRANQALEAALNDARKLPGWQTRSYLQDVRIHFAGYAEPGYSTATGIIATGNWNNVNTYDQTTQTSVRVSSLPSRLGGVFEKLGIEIEWSDEWSECSDCGKLFRTQGDSYSWQPSYVMGDGEIICHECVASDPEAHLEALEGNAAACNTIASIDPAQHGYTRVDSYETGWHPGQTDDPEVVAKGLEDRGVTRYLFNLEGNQQFDSHWSVYVHDDEIELLNEGDGNGDE
jgi:hypothetical protein